RGAAPAARLGRPRAQTALELLDRRRHEDRHGAGHPLLGPPRPLRLQLQQRRAAFVLDPLAPREKRPVAVSDVPDPLEEPARLDPARELVVAEEPVLEPVPLA